MLTKILFTVGLIVAVWRGFKWIETLRARLDAAEKGDAAKRRERAAAAKKARAIDLEPCKRCGAYVPKGEICPSCDPPPGGDRTKD